ncbi:hypothetical protein BAUCODRAFT_104896 [Baudoinia panamericana UAMH 10762]|uniref:SRP9 domain-containing protein n=1 Tax=Baudoinia panamericana (strain UAMH 10762) TaxID=717646 RepID=M2LTW3_BAUPA|nr:uncharacterized protein BAUCODRAFT_104896 [Baudoinia panamericana UAMH 10762]EMC97972.1 hypothetical protein BAUCODRAFT_104896 [Baudoinia panamericana UAMH 10762]
MVYLNSPEEWQRQSALLLQARPTTTRITTKYKIPNLESPKYLKSTKRKQGGETEAKENAATKVPRAALVLKTYDPESGVVLKLKTDRAADVGRLINGLGRLGRHMAALPEKAEASSRQPDDTSNLAAVKDSEGVVSPSSQQTQQPTGGGAGGKKKKKGKK